MYLSSLSFLIPILSLKLPIYIHIPLVGLLISSLIYHNYPNKFTKFIDYANIINVCSNIYFRNYYFSFLFILFFFIEYSLYNMTNFKNIVYFLSYSKYSEYFYVNLFFFSSLVIYFIHISRKEFTSIQRWLWHLGQAMFIFSSLSTEYDTTPFFSIVQYYFYDILEFFDTFFMKLITIL